MNKKIHTYSIPSQLPVLPLRDMVMFPKMILPLTVNRAKSINALEAVANTHRLVFLSAQRSPQTEDPARDNLYEMGTVGEIIQLIKSSDGKVKVLMEGLTRARMIDFHLISAGYVRADIQLVPDKKNYSYEAEALTRRCLMLFEQYIKLQEQLPNDIVSTVAQLGHPSDITDAIAGHIILKISDKQEVLEHIDLEQRQERLIHFLTAENEILILEKRIQNRVRHQIEKSQKEYYLTEQMKAIQKELRKKDEHGKEVDDLKKQIKEAKMSKEAEEVAHKELARIEKMMPLSPESTVSRTYLDWLIHLPWAVRTTDSLELKKAELVLNEDHFGLDKAKERIIEYLAVLKLVNKIKGPILCFVGPPGVGKTSLAKSIARALGRKFVRLSLGGVRDESEIRGHRRTYIGSLPGRMIQSMRKAKSKNPVFLLDEIDKMGSDWRGDPASALLEVLDPEQNSSFVDHYLDVEFDLSEIMFITTANTLYTIPVTLRDRLEIIRFPGYTTQEKLTIAENFLIPKQMKEHGLTPNVFDILPDTLHRLVHDYTQEAGVRNLEREIANLCRKAARQFVGEGKKKIKISGADLPKFLGAPKYSKDKTAMNSVGVATGLAWTEHGGETLSVEVNVLPGKGKLLLTGKLGDVMQESAQAALTYVRSKAGSLNIRKDPTLRNRDLHIHIPEGAVPKDGPSAGIAMATAVASALTGRSVKKHMAMTGEITLRGRVLPIGGLKEKVLAAHREGLHTVLFPQGNYTDLDDIPQDIQEKIKLVPVKSMSDVIQHALEKRK